MTYGLQWDSVGPLPFVPALQAYYVNGKFAHRPYTTGRGRVWIDVTGAAPLDAFWLDVEKEDAVPEQAPGWLGERHHAGMGWGGIYCNRSTLPKVLDAAGTMPFSLWLATLDGTADPGAIPELAHLPSTVTLCAIQAYPAAQLGFNADLSVITDRGYWEARHA